MATYTIQIWNQSDFSKSYVAFMQSPIVSSRGGNPQVFQNAWATFDSVTNGGFDSITYDDVTYAYWGTTPSQLAPNTTVLSGGVALVDTAAQSVVPFSGVAPLGFGDTVNGGAQTGSYAIAATSDFTARNGYVFGLAKPGKTPIPSPVATFVAEPNDTFNITPVEKFYVSDSAYAPGAVIDVTTTSTSFVEIDFTGKPQNTATVIQNADGSFSVTYSS